MGDPATAQLACARRFGYLANVSSLDRLTRAFRPVRVRLAQAFFANFFRLLLIALSLSEWCVVWWLCAAQIERLPWVIHLAAPVLIYTANRQLTLHVLRQRRQQPARQMGSLLRLYQAVTFTCLFCTLFLLLTDTLWVAAKVLLEALTVEAWTVPAGGVESGVNTLFRWFSNAGMLTIVITFAYGYTVGQLRLRVTRLQLPLRGWPAALEGLRVVQISDIHIGQHLERAQLEHFVGRVNALQPDLVCITGDIVDAPTADVEGFLPVLAKLSATHGVFAILGNHDHYAGADRVEAALRQLTPFTVLRDQYTSITVRGTRLHVIGLDDRGRDWARGATRAPYLTAALAAVPPDEPVLLLCHRPDIFRQAAAAGVALTLSGHTHGGQLGIPWFNGRVRNLAEFFTAFDRGLFERNGCLLYVNSGLGATGQRIRLCTPREITVLELQQVTALRAAA